MEARGKSSRHQALSTYAVSHARFKRTKKRLRDFFLAVNRKGHEHITLMIASHSANTPVFTIRISKYIVIFILMILVATVGFSLTALADKNTSDPEIAKLQLKIKQSERVLELFVRNTESLESSLEKLTDHFKAFVALTGIRELDRMALFSGVRASPEQVPPAPNTPRGLTRLDRVNLNLLRGSQQAERLRRLIWAMRPYYRFSFFRHLEREPRSSIPCFWPVDNGGVITSPFGIRYNCFTGQYSEHNAVDIANSRGTLIRATAPGLVTRVDNEPAGYGLYVEIKHDKGYLTRYAHLDRQEVLLGDIVYQGQIIGRMGRTGLATGDHVHYEVVKDGEFLDPEEFMDKKFKPWDLPQP